jgi:4-amino-4-deoxy-L-arabinose transferase-like glycosyltransferase
MMSAIVAGERAVTRAAYRTQIIWTIAAGVLSSFAFLTRSFGAVLIVAILAYMIKSKALRNALMFAVVAGVLSLPWVVYSGVHKPSPELRLEQDGSIVQPITEQFWQRRAGIGLAGTVTTRDLPERVWANAVHLRPRSGPNSPRRFRGAG